MTRRNTNNAAAKEQQSQGGAIAWRSALSGSECYHQKRAWVLATISICKKGTSLGQHSAAKQVDM
jgi:hypothetical protein